MEDLTGAKELAMTEINNQHRSKLRNEGHRVYNYKKLRLQTLVAKVVGFKLKIFK